MTNEDRKPKLNDPFCKRFEAARGTNKQLAHLNGVLSKVDDALHNDSDSVREVIQEKPIHRRFVDLQLQGYTPTEIAKLTGFSMQWVSQVLKQPFARQRFIQESKKTVQEEMKEFLEAEVLPSLQALKKVRDDDHVRAADKISASNSLLDRFLGKPVQPIAENQKPPSELSDEELRKQVEAELAQAAKQ